MTRTLLARALAAFFALVALGSCVVYQRAHIDEIPMPSDDIGVWALGALESARLGRDLPAAPAGSDDYESAGPVFVIAWWRGRPVSRHVGVPELATAIREATASFAGNPALTSLAGWSAGPEDHDRVRFTVSITRGEGPVWMGVPFVENLDLVPLLEGLHVSIAGKDAWVTPEELRATGAYDRGVRTPLPDLSFGVDIRALTDQLAREVGFDGSDVSARGTVSRFRATSILPAKYPRTVEVTEESLREAAIDGARFLLRHQRPDGTYTYVYDARTGRATTEAYNLPRHSGSTYFLAQIHNLANLPEAREGARRALEWVRRTRIRECGGPDVLCVEAYGRSEIGSTALTALAAAEYLSGGDDADIRTMLTGLTAHIRSLQRDDGEMMHEWDLERGEPVDVQYLYYSGEAAFALMRAHAVLGDQRDLEAARRLMAHLTGAGWDFLGSRYYYGEEHWTCIAASEASDRIESPEALDFCQRWASFNRRVQYGPGETPWPSDGAYGVGPLLLPRLTPVASRSEAFISTYQMARRAGVEDAALRDQIERGLGMLVRYRWDPGPTHLLFNPAAASGGLPGSPTELMVRNDYVQHACSAMIRWSDLLRQERERGAE